jgi:L-lactate dehydrogenase complex protein LldF
MNSPRRQLDQDGPRQRHLVLVDNGRTAMRASPLAEALLCIRCGACLNACPIFREIGGHAYVNLHGESTIYPGPIGSIVSPGLLGQANYGHLARASTLCGACQEACPVDINLPKLLLRTRAGGLKIDHQPAQGPRALAIGLRLYAWLATDPRRFALSQRLAAALTGILSPHKKWVRLPAFTGWGTSRHLLKPAARPFRAQWGQEIASTSGPTLQDTPTRIPPIIDLDTQEVTADKETPFKGPLMDRQALIEQFQSELTALGGTATLCEEKDLAAELLIYLRARQVTSLMSWEAAQLPDGLLTALTDGGIRIISQLQTADPEKTNPRFGLTGALAAIAETGTLALDSGTGRPLETSLVPEVHIAVLHSEAIYQSLTQVLRLRKVREASSVVLISGPSRTADIEMTLTIGVHGPTEVHVFCIK